MVGIRIRLLSFALVILAAPACGMNNDGQGTALPGSDSDSSAAGGNTGGASATGGAGGAGACVSGGFPAAVQSVLGARCQTCHGNPPLPSVPASLTSPANFAQPSKSGPGMTIAQVTITRVTSTTATLRMPPVPADPLSAGELQTLRAWIAAGMPTADCAPNSDGGVPAPPAGPDPFAAAPKCTSGTTWTGGTRESPLMQPGEACVACHSKAGSEAPRLSFAGTIYPSAHEPTQCNGADGTNSAQGAVVVVIDASGKSFSASVNAAGNFYGDARTVVTPPLKAKVVFMGRERLMIGAVPNGDCNACHTQTGTTTITTMGTLPAPGRIILP